MRSRLRKEFGLNLLQRVYVYHEGSKPSWASGLFAHSRCL